MVSDKPAATIIKTKTFNAFLRPFINHKSKIMGNTMDVNQGVLLRLVRNGKNASNKLFANT